MLPKLRGLAKHTLRKLDIGLTSWKHLEELEKSGKLDNLKARNMVELLLNFHDEHAAKLLNILRKSNSQLGQDVFALSETGLKEGGFFVEFGATNGIHLSNTYLLEKEFGWNGIVAEPAMQWHTDLRNNRSCHIEIDCVWKESNAHLLFNEASYGELSTLDAYSSSDLHSTNRTHGKKYEVSTISLVDMLDKYRAPRTIDYLSIDTEGSEYEILASFDFSKYQFRVITCEHNYESLREKIFSLLTKNGYVRKYEELSEFDDWYVKAGLA